MNLLRGGIYIEFFQEHQSSDLKIMEYRRKQTPTKLKKKYTLRGRIGRFDVSNIYRDVPQCGCVTKKRL